MDKQKCVIIFLNDILDTSYRNSESKQIFNLSSWAISFAFVPCCAGNILCACSQRGIPTVYQVVQHNTNFMVTDELFLAAIYFMLYLPCHLQIKNVYVLNYNSSSENKGYSIIPKRTVEKCVWSTVVFWIPSVSYCSMFGCSRTWTVLRG